MPPKIYWIHRRLSPTTGPIFNLRLGLDVPQDKDLISPHIMFAGMFIAAHAHRFSHGLGRSQFAGSGLPLVRSYPGIRNSRSSSATPRTLKPAESSWSNWELFQYLFAEEAPV